MQLAISSLVTAN